MMNLENKQDKSLTDSLELLGLKETRLKQQGKTQARRRLLITVCLIFMIGEVIGGYAAHSLAIMTDAAHLLTDFGSISISLFSLWISSRPPFKCLTFGWHRSDEQTKPQTVLMDMTRLLQTEYGFSNITIQTETWLIAYSARTRWTNM